MMIKVRELNASEWDVFALKTPQYTVFSSSAFMLGYGLALRFLIYEDDLNNASVGLCFVANGNIHRLQAFQALNGLHFLLPESTDRFKLEKHLTDFALEHLLKEFASIHLCSHWSLVDQRVYLQKGFEVVPRYTSHLDITSDQQVRGNCRSGHLKSLRVAEKMNIQVATSDDFPCLVHLSRLTFLRQGLKMSDSDARDTENICRSLQLAGAGQMLIARLPDSEAPVGALFMGFDRMRGYYMFGATDPEFRKVESGTKLLFSAFEMLRARRILSVDFVGINSPQRGGYKLGFGGNIVRYFSARLPRS